MAKTLHISCPPWEYRSTAKKDDQRDVTKIKTKKTEDLSLHTRPIGSNTDCNLQRSSSIKGTTAKLAVLSLNRQSSGGDIMTTNWTIGQIRNTAIVIGAAALLPLSAYACGCGSPERPCRRRNPSRPSPGRWLPVGGGVLARFPVPLRHLRRRGPAAKAPGATA